MVHRIDNLSSIRRIKGDFIVDGTITSTGSLTTGTIITNNNPVNLPTTVGSAGQTLQTDGGGNLVWVTPTSGATNTIFQNAASVYVNGPSDTITISASSTVVASYKPNLVQLFDSGSNEIFRATNTLTTIATTLALNNSSGFGVQFSANAAQAASYPLIFPATQGGVNQVLKTDGFGNLSWSSAGGSSTASNIAYSPATVTTSTTLSTTSMINADCTAANITLTLPAQASAPGQQYVIWRVDASGNTVTVAPASGERLLNTVNGTVVLQSQDDRIVLVTNGTRGWISV